MIYFGPMGCQTGFYVLLDNNQLTMEDCITLVQSVFEAGANYTGEMPGKSAVECGNYINLDVDLARTQCRYYVPLLRRSHPGLDRGTAGILIKKSLHLTVERFFLLCTYPARLSRSRAMRSAIMAINSLLVGLPLVLDTV